MPGSVVFNLPSPDAGGYTVLGSPTVIADLTVTGAPAESTEIASRLLDVDASGNELLVARGVYRPDAAGQQVFQLHPMGFHIAEDHHLQLELLGHEAPTQRQSNMPFTIDVANLDLRIPVAEPPDGQQIQSPAAKELPPGYLPEPGFLLLFASGVGGVAILGRRRIRKG